MKNKKKENFKIMVFDGDPCIPIGDEDLFHSEPYRTRIEYPYSYDPFTIWGGRNKKANGNVYSDRLRQWDYEKYVETAKKIFGKESVDFERDNPKKIEQFVSELIGKKIKLTRIVQWCNVCNGFPLWQLFFIEE